MKYAATLILGILGGAVIAAVLLYFNPLTRQQSLPPDEAGWTFRYSLAAEDTWLSTHATGLGLPIVPENVQLPYERGISGTLVAAMPVTDVTNGEGAAATRISIPSARTELLRSGLIVEDYWLISVPGKGSVLVHGVNNHWPMVRDTVVRVNWLKRDWNGPGRYGPTRGPASIGAEVRGLTGQFAGAEGSARERVVVDAYDGSLSGLAGSLLVDLAPVTP